MRGLIAVVVVVTLGIYAPVLDAGWVYEDHNWVGELNSSWSFARWPGRNLTTLTYALQADQSVRAFHAVNVALHLSVGLLVALWARRMGLTALGTLVGTSLFLWHPVNAQAVAYLSARSDLLMAFWTLGALCFATWRSPFGVIGALACGFLAAGSKEIGLVSFALIAAVWMPAVSWKWRIGLAASAVVLLGWYVVKVPGLLGAWPEVGGWIDMASANTTLVWRWLALFVIPVGLSIDPDPWAVSLLVRMVGVGLLVGLVGFAITRWPWAVGMSAVVILPRILLPTYEPLMEHHLYLAMVPLCLLIGSALDKGVLT